MDFFIKQKEHSFHEGCDFCRVDELKNVGEKFKRLSVAIMQLDL